MHIEDLRDYCLSKPYVNEELPFGPDTLVFKVGGKVFALLGIDQLGDDLRINVKCDPERAIALRSEFADTVFPGYHMNKKHWNTMHCNRQLSDSEIQKLIDHSYDLIFEALPKAVKAALLG
ncbi:MmcQ/YjbR family DNA-binding protein [Sphingobacterium psychroaquaticum]|uniref:Predicted DNA-binding protein, MmcQ/YjbR family n=1 Tax=Sphingobacterium psychroaquaticum TaxID=561061 RepID=A0A1X7J9L9_9SPHI|nr:MmcQ/YjbR family DNA-binding protein [Sphingobacterium psychroaquaticum]SMG24386.1 Predicted DNA-binding protein, MmcQ/YjbR family [Sphingobacterium psychroaquaticum]